MTTSSIKHLIFTNKRDITSDFIVREFKKRGLGYLRFNTEDISEIKLTQHFDHIGTKIQNGTETVDLENIVSAYFRRPSLPNFNTHDMSNSSKAYCTDEWNYILRSIYLELDQKWFSHPNNIILAEDKPKQLRLAKELGFNVPQTVITNVHNDVIPLFKLGPVIAKPFRHALLKDQDGERIIFTSIIESLDSINSDELLLAPVIFQRQIIKKYDLRITVVGERIFAVSIDSQSHSHTKTDWRHSSVEQLDHKIVKLDEQLSEKCISIVRRLGLRYGAIDLILDTHGVYWFLECNPNGQWAWIENRTGLQIASAIVDVMESV